MPLPPTSEKDLTIRRAGASDLEALRQISIRTFTEAFAEQNTEENMRAYLDEKFNGAELLKQINTDGSLFFTAAGGNKLLGYLKVNFASAQSDLQAENTLEIERIYVLQECKGTGVGSRLFEKALELAKSCGISYLWLGVWEHNHSAIAFYKKHGFIEFERHLFKLGEDEQTDLLMKLPL